MSPTTVDRSAPLHSEQARIVHLGRVAGGPRTGREHGPGALERDVLPVGDVRSDLLEAVTCGHRSLLAAEPFHEVLELMISAARHTRLIERVVVVGVEPLLRAGHDGVEALRLADVVPEEASAALILLDADYSLAVEPANLFLEDV